MNWSKHPPTEPGLYQYRPAFGGITVFYRIERAPSGALVAMIEGSLEWMDLYDLPGQWRGPILDLSTLQ
jgi:hypothetical protein